MVCTFVLSIPLNHRWHWPHLTAPCWSFCLSAVHLCLFRLPSLLKRSSHRVQNDDCNDPEETRLFEMHRKTFLTLEPSLTTLALYFTSLLRDRLLPLNNALTPCLIWFSSKSSFVQISFDLISWHTLIFVVLELIDTFFKPLPSTLCFIIPSYQTNVRSLTRSPLRLWKPYIQNSAIRHSGHVTKPFWLAFH